jgi:hypothetical protein
LDPEVESLDVLAVGETLLVARLDGEGWEECVRFAHDVATPGVEGHVERMIDSHALHEPLEASTGQRA